MIKLRNTNNRERLVFFKLTLRFEWKTLYVGFTEKLMKYFTQNSNYIKTDGFHISKKQ